MLLCSTPIRYREKRLSGSFEFYLKMFVTIVCASVILISEWVSYLWYGEIKLEYSEILFCLPFLIYNIKPIISLILREHLPSVFNTEMLVCLLVMPRKSKILG